MLVGGGIVGLATAYQLLRKNPDCRVTLLEKEYACGQHQSTHNSGVLHCGLYYKPGSLKARLAVEGIRSMTAFCREHDIEHEICGKIVLATDLIEVERLKSLHERGVANGLSGLRWLAPEEIQEREPYARGLAALLVPEEGIVDYAAVIRALEKEIIVRGGRIVCGAEVLKVRKDSEGWFVETTAGDFKGGYWINCAGLHCDRIAEESGEALSTRIIPFRGEYFKLRKDAKVTLKHLIYPVPDPAFPFLGVHFTRLIEGGFEAGPSAVLATAREGYKRTDINLRDLSEALRFQGLWKFMAKYPRMCALEFARSLSPSLFVKALQKLVPEIQQSDLETGGAGVRAQAMERDGTLQQDFALLKRADALHVLNAPSPAATASLAIAEHLVNCISEK